jgi:hypothetical protein
VKLLRKNLQKMSKYYVVFGAIKSLGDTFVKGFPFPWRFSLGYLEKRAMKKRK